MSGIPRRLLGNFSHRLASCERHARRVTARPRGVAARWRRWIVLTCAIMLGHVSVARASPWSMPILQVDASRAMQRMERSVGAVSATRAAQLGREGQLNWAHAFAAPSTTQPSPTTDAATPREDGPTVSPPASSRTTGTLELSLIHI